MMIERKYIVTRPTTNGDPITRVRIYKTDLESFLELPNSPIRPEVKIFKLFFVDPPNEADGT